VEKETTLLLADDDAKLVAALSIYLQRCGYHIITATDGLSALQQLYNHRPDLVLLDVMMPNMDGWEACRRMRELSSVPVMMLTARDQEEDKITGLRLGADDYIAKPFSMRELVARVEAVLRRSKVAAPESNQVVIVDSELTIDRSRWEVRRHELPVPLTSTEMRLLFFLVESANHVLTHRQILEYVWGPEYATETDYAKLFIWRLRQKLEADPRHPKYILTERGIGYRFCTKF
jgi:two-component system, OmpR family, KDP operon response regulator KdpE